MKTQKPSPTRIALKKTKATNMAPVRWQLDNRDDVEVGVPASGRFFLLQRDGGIKPRHDKSRQITTTVNPRHDKSRRKTTTLEFSSGRNWPSFGGWHLASPDQELEEKQL
jgi:hypothetical protein